MSLIYLNVGIHSYYSVSRVRWQSGDLHEWVTFTLTPGHNALISCLVISRTLSLESKKGVTTQSKVSMASILSGIPEEYRKHIYFLFCDLWVAQNLWHQTSMVHWPNQACANTCSCYVWTSMCWCEKLLFLVYNNAKLAKSSALITECIWCPSHNFLIYQNTLRNSKDTTLQSSVHCTLHWLGELSSLHGQFSFISDDVTKHAF